MTNQYLWDRIAGRDPNIRAADADRERIAERLRQGHSEGRLDTTEFQQRLERCYESKTMGELEELVRDLPKTSEPADRFSAGQLQRRPWRLGPLAPMLIVLILIAASVGHHGFWLWLPLLFLIWRMASWRRRRWSTGPRRGPGGWI